MAGSSFNIGLSALFAAQQGLTTTGHNIANVNTEGYSRQRVSFETRSPQFIGVGYLGKGVNVQSIARITDQFLVDQVRNANSNEARAARMSDLINQVDRQFGGGLLADGMQNFFDAVGDANDDPRLMATRQVLIENARTMLARFSDQEAQLNDIARNSNQQITATVQEINALTRTIADLNLDIVRLTGQAGGAPANDLLDQREHLLVELSERVGVQIQRRTDGMINVLVGDGQLVVAGGTQSLLAAQPNAFDASRIEVALEVGGSFTEITAAISGGELGALVDFRDEILEPARNAVGRLAATLALTINEQHRQGMDLNGALGSDLFSVPVPKVNAAAANAGTLGVAFDAANIGQLTTSDYRLRHDGTNFNLTRLSDSSVQTLVGGGPFNVEGLTITVISAPAANDDYLIQPTKFVPRTLQLATTDAAKLALASPVRTANVLANIGDARISRAEILDPTDAALLTTTRLVFNDPPTTFQVNGVGPLIAFTSAADIDLNGWRVQVNGAPVAGDTFTIESNAGGTGDNSNGLGLGQLQFTPILAGGTASYQEAYGIAVGAVGAAANQIRISHSALATLSENARASLEAISGVNLDEEAANLLRFQQSYQAAAQVIAAAEAVFQILMDATRR